MICGGSLPDLHRAAASSSTCRRQVSRDVVLQGIFEWTRLNSQVPCMADPAAPTLGFRATMHRKIGTRRIGCRHACIRRRLHWAAGCSGTASCLQCPMASVMLAVSQRLRVSASLVVFLHYNKLHLHDLAHQATRAAEPTAASVACRCGSVQQSRQLSATGRLSSVA